MSAPGQPFCPRCGGADVSATLANGLSELRCATCGYEEAGPYTPSSMFEPGHQYRVRVSWVGPATTATAMKLRRLVTRFADQTPPAVLAQLEGRSWWDLDLVSARSGSRSDFGRSCSSSSPAWWGDESAIAPTREMDDLSRVPMRCDPNTSRMECPGVRRAGRFRSPATSTAAQRGCSTSSPRSVAFFGSRTARTRSGLKPSATIST